MKIEFASDAVDKIAAMAEQMNLEMENIGARRLHTMIEQLLDEISFTAPERMGENIIIDEAFVVDRLGSLVKNSDVRRYLL